MRTVLTAVAYTVASKAAKAGQLRDLPQTGVLMLYLDTGSCHLRYSVIA